MSEERPLLPAEAERLRRELARERYRLARLERITDQRASEAEQRESRLLHELRDLEHLRAWAEEVLERMWEGGLTAQAVHAEALRRGVIRRVDGEGRDGRPWPAQPWYLTAWEEEEDCPACAHPQGGDPE